MVCMGYRGEIGLDMDGVQCKTHVPILRAVNSELRTHFRHGEIVSYHFVSEKTQSLTGDKELAGRLSGLWFESSILQQAPPYRARILSLKLLQLMGILSRTVTSRPPKARTITEDWYRKNWSFIQSDGRLHMLATDSKLDGNSHKLETIEKYRLPLFFEDFAQTIRYFRNQGYMGGRLVDQPWNRGAEYRDLDDARVFGTVGILGSIWQAYSDGQL